MIVTVHDFGSAHGGIHWSNPRSDELDAIDLDDWSDTERAALADAIVEQVTAWPKRPVGKMTYQFAVRETWREVGNGR